MIGGSFILLEKCNFFSGLFWGYIFGQLPKVNPSPVSIYQYQFLRFKVGRNVRCTVGFFILDRYWNCFFEAFGKAKVTKIKYLKTRFLIFSEFRIKKNKFFFQNSSSISKKSVFFLQNIDKNIKNPTSDALDFVKLALLGASEKQFQ